jgi:glucose dehydrogenase
VSLPCQKPPWARLIAVDANTGDISWLDWTVNANPMTYLGRDGKQYVAVMATEELLVFGL